MNNELSRCTQKRIETKKANGPAWKEPMDPHNLYSATMAAKKKAECKTDQECMSLKAHRANILMQRFQNNLRSKLSAHRVDESFTSMSGHLETNQGPSDCCSDLQSDALPIHQLPPAEGPNTRINRFSDHSLDQCQMPYIQVK